MKLLMIVIVSGGYMLEPINVPDNKSCEQVYKEQVEIVPNPKYTSVIVTGKQSQSLKVSLLNNKLFN